MAKKSQKQGMSTIKIVRTFAFVLVAVCIVYIYTVYAAPTLSRFSPDDAFFGELSAGTSVVLHQPRGLLASIQKIADINDPSVYTVGGKESCQGKRGFVISFGDDPVPEAILNAPSMACVEVHPVSSTLRSELQPNSLIIFLPRLTHDIAMNAMKRDSALAPHAKQLIFLQKQKDMGFVHESMEIQKESDSHLLLKALMKRYPIKGGVNFKYGDQLIAAGTRGRIALSGALRGLEVSLVDDCAICLEAMSVSLALNRVLQSRAKLHLMSKDSSRRIDSVTDFQRHPFLIDAALSDVPGAAKTFEHGIAFARITLDGLDSSNSDCGQTLLKTLEFFKLHGYNIYLDKSGLDRGKPAFTGDKPTEEPREIDYASWRRFHDVMSDPAVHDPSGMRNYRIIGSNFVRMASAYCSRSVTEADEPIIIVVNRLSLANPGKNI